ncbi:unnamed protein product [Cuscuta campestris]|uniref:Cell division cycle protein 123 homolog n=1 Tax=Cuscuta campestris TaxID=132261 RepID=A0A484K1Y5_9ASTE|nr:unnamed protein product [Cuscuta campestris]
MKEDEVNRCQIQEWYPKFKSISIKTEIHHLPESFIDYLLDDKGPFLLPLSIEDNDALPNRIHNSEDEAEEEGYEGTEDESETPPSTPSFPELEMKVKESIQSLGGSVFPKLNWSSPKDSAWISTTGNLKCSSFSEISLLFKSSDSLTHDLCHAYDSCSDKTISRPHIFVLALRKWYPSLRPEMEFRCFVKNHALVGVSQREITTFYPSLLEDKNVLKAAIQTFFLSNLKGKFESERYTFDVYVARDRIRLLDFNPWGAFTLPLLFTWGELEDEIGGDEFQFRIVENRLGVRPGLKTAVPQDYTDTSLGSGWDEFMRKANVEFQQQINAGEAGA